MPDMTSFDDSLLVLETQVREIISILREHTQDVNSYIVDIDANFQTLNKKIDSLHKDSTKEFGEVKSELKKIQAVTSYKDAFKNLKIVK